MMSYFLTKLRQKRRKAESLPKKSRSKGYVPVLEALECRCLLAGGYYLSALVSDVPALAQHHDPNLINPWGMSFRPGGDFWITDAGTGLSTIYDAQGRPSPLVVTVPAARADAPRSEPTGTVYNDGPGFVISKDGRSGPGLFLFATEDGGISGWNPGVDLTGAVEMVARQAESPAEAGPVYTGLSLAAAAESTFLYAANFQKGVIDVFDDRFQPVELAGSFSDPSLPPGYAPFNIHEIGGSLLVTFIEKNDGRYDGSRAGNGIIDVFNTDGELTQRLVSHGPLDLPWGMALAPGEFGELGNSLLVGNFGDGRINAFDPQTGDYLGYLRDEAGDAVAIPGLWSLAFHGDGSADNNPALYFAAGIGHEHHGLFGRLQPNRSADIVAGTGSATELFQRVEALSLQFEADHDSGYPLPPRQGPATDDDARAPARQRPALISLHRSPLTVIPTLISASALQNSLIDPRALPTEISTGIDNNQAAPTASPQKPTAVLVSAVGRDSDLAPAMATLECCPSVESASPQNGTVAAQDFWYSRDAFAIRGSHQGGNLNLPGHLNSVSVQLVGETSCQDDESQSEAAVESAGVINWVNGIAAITALAYPLYRFLGPRIRATADNVLFKKGMRLSTRRPSPTTDGNPNDSLPKTRKFSVCTP